MTRTLPFNLTIALIIVELMMSGCARLPETTRVLYDDDRVVTRLETDFDAPERTYSHKADLSLEQLNGLLRGYTVRPRSHVPLQAVIDNSLPRKLFRESELNALVPPLREALQQVGYHERIRFEVFSPGRNPKYWRDVTGGWIKVRHHFFHLVVDYFHVEQPVRKMDAYDRYYPSPWTPERAYTVNFEPERLYVTDPVLDEYAVDLDLLTASTPP